MPESFFLINGNSVDLQTSLKMSFQRMSFLANFVKFVRTPFLQNTTGQLLLIIIVSLVVKGELVKENLNHKNLKLKKLKNM